MIHSVAHEVQGGAALINHCVTACMPQASQENNKNMQTKRYKGSIGLAKNKGIRDTITISVINTETFALSLDGRRDNRKRN